MASSDLWDPSAVSSLQSQLLDTKLSRAEHTFFPSQAFARGGIGALVSTGSARGGISRLPLRARGARAAGVQPSIGTSFNCSRPDSLLSSRRVPGMGATRPGTTGTGASSSIWSRGNGVGQPWGSDASSLAAAAAASVVLGPDAAGVPHVAKHEWERGVQHPHNFVSTTRQTRVTDVRPASKWATLSLYETDPRKVKRHLDIVGIIDKAHAGGKTMERDTERMRHFTWAMQQREVFRRQRQEVAVRYAQAGLPPRKAYSAAAAGFGAGAEPAGSGGLLQGASSSLMGTPRPGTGSTEWTSLTAPLLTTPSSIPKTTYGNVYHRVATEAADLLESSIEGARRRAGEAAQAKAEAELKSHLVDMDNFEQHLQGILRRQDRGKAATVNAEPSMPAASN